MTLVGVPGIGKSRLVAELAAGVESDPEPIVWRLGRSLPYGEGVTFWAVAEMAKAQAGILHSDDAAEAGAKLAEAVRALIPGEGEARWVESHLRPLVGLDDELGRSNREEAFGAWRRFFEAMAERGPLVLVFEDLHWADEALLDFVDELADRAVDVPMLVVATARADLFERRPRLGRRQAERGDRVALAALRHRHGAPAGHAAGEGGAACRHAGGVACARRRRPALRGGIRADARGSWPPPGRPARGGRAVTASRDGAGDHRRAPGRALGGGEGDRPGRSRDRTRILDRRAAGDRRARSG